MSAEMASCPATGQLYTRIKARSRAVLAGGLVALVWMLPASTSAHSAPSLLASLDAPGFSWDRVQSMELAGIPVHLRPFSSPSTAHAAAESLVHHTGLFQRVLAVQDKVVLSRLDAHWHWLAEINVTSAGAAGYVSVMRIVADGVHSADSESGHDASWLPENAKRRFSQRTSVDKKILTQQLYSSAHSAGELTSYLRRKLRDSGWIKDPDFAAVPGATVWQRQHLRLTLIPIAQPEGSSLFVQYLE